MFKIYIKIYLNVNMLLKGMYLVHIVNMTYAE